MTDVDTQPLGWMETLQDLILIEIIIDHIGFKLGWFFAS